jgi:hypothetical protein
MSDDNRGTGDNGSRFKPGNTGPDGSYVVGKNRPPVTTRFAPGDGRERGRRPKGTKNLKTDFAEELASKIPLKENGKRMHVTKQRAMVKVLLDNATKGQNRAIEITLNQHSRHFGGDDPSRTAGALPQTDQEIVDAYIMHRMRELELGEDALDDRPAGANNDAGEPDNGSDAVNGGL